MSRRRDLAIGVLTILFIGSIILAGLLGSVIPVVVTLGLFGLLVAFGY